MSWVAGTNCLTIAEDKLRTMLSESDAFQTFVGAANATAALTSIYIEATPLPDDREEYTSAEWSTYFPHGLIYTQPEQGLSLEFVADNVHQPRGAMAVRVHRLVTAGEKADPELKIRNIKNEGGLILEEMAVQSNTSGRLAIQANYEGVFGDELVSGQAETIYFEFNVTYGTIQSGR